MSERILCVDDDLNILASFQRQLRNEFQIVAALGGEQALKTLAERGPFAVVVSDLQMPKMSGLEFLAKVQEVSPASVRIIFSGRADLNTAIAAVNQGNIFRFLTKPCPPGILTQALTAALAQHRLIVAERELLEKTLRRSVQMLVDILALLKPSLFSRSSRIQTYTMHIVGALNGGRWQWQMELAAMLSQLGCITLPEALVEKAMAGESLTREERNEFDSHPAAGARLIGNIPRLEQVTEIIRLQHKPFRSFKQRSAKDDEHGEMIDFGAQALRVAIEFDRMRSKILDAGLAIEMLKAEDGEYHPDMIAALASVESSGTPMRRLEVSVNDLKPKMITLSNVYSTDGALLLARDLEISGPMVEVLRKLGQTRGIHQPLSVLAPVEPEAIRTAGS